MKEYYDQWDSPKWLNVGELAIFLGKGKIAHPTQEEIENLSGLLSIKGIESIG